MPSVLIVGSPARQSLESSYARAFRKLGWAVGFWDPAEALARVAKGGKIGQLFSTFIHVEPWLRKANLELLSSAESQRPDLILVIATGGVRGGTLAQVKALLPDTRIYCVYPDSPHNLDADRIHCLPFFDRVTASSPAWTKAFRALGARSVEYLPFAADTELHRPAALRPGPPFGHDLAFIGTWRPERESLLERLADFDLCVWGGKYWATRTAASSAVRSRWGGREIVGEEFAQVCGASKILLNIMDPVTWPGPNMRTFEQPACRAFSLVSRSSAVLEFFKEGTDIECFDSVEEARDKIRYYLGHESERLKIADAGFKLVTEGGHTYADRARQIMIWAVEDGARV